MKQDRYEVEGRSCGDEMEKINGQRDLQGASAEHSSSTPLHLTIYDRTYKAKVQPRSVSSLLALGILFSAYLIPHRVNTHAVIAPRVLTNGLWLKGSSCTTSSKQGPGNGSSALGFGLPNWARLVKNL